MILKENQKFREMFIVADYAALKIFVQLTR